MFGWNKVALVAGGFLAGTYGLKILGSKDAKKVYTQCTAAVLRMKDEVVKDVTVIKENAEDIGAAAVEINEQRRREQAEKDIEDAKILLARAGVLTECEESEEGEEEA
ncbi:MAG: hypothetical protein IIZ39_00215 [Blautia sp.]|nr:hypothetical protein [Blautia sp.]